MKSKGRIAWLITWEGPGAEYDGRCKVVAILPANYHAASILQSLRVLYHSEATLTLDERMVPCASVYKDPYYKRAYFDVNPEYYYGHLGEHYLTARKVDNLRCEDSKGNRFETTLFWTEREKFIPNPKYGEEGSTLPDALIQIIGKREVQYTYSIRPAVEEEKARRAKQKKVVENGFGAPVRS